MVDPMRLNIGFVSTRFAGIDGVSLESSKWARVLEDEGHTCFWFAGENAKSEDISLQVSQANFKDDQNQWINRQLFGTHKKSLQLARIMCDYKSAIASRLKLFIDMYQLDLLVVENALAIPMHIPLGLALTDVIAETGIPTIAHHHDFYWERNRYLPLNGLPANQESGSVLFTIWWRIPLPPGKIQMIVFLCGRFIRPPILLPFPVYMRVSAMPCLRPYTLKSLCWSTAIKSLKRILNPGVLTWSRWTAT